MGSSKFKAWATSWTISSPARGTFRMFAPFVSCMVQNVAQPTNLYVGKLKMRIRRKVRVSGVKLPRRIVVSKMQSLHIQENRSNAFKEFDGTWGQLRIKVYTVGAEVLGYKQREHRDWLDENDASTTKLLETKNKLHVELLNATDARRTVAEKSFKEAKASLQCKIRQMKNNWWSEILIEMY